jgi:lantibiotic leader peptide-processing serine protease
MSSIRTARHRAVSVVAVLALAGGIAGVAATPGAAAPSSESQTFIVLYKKSASPADAAATVANAGGTLVANWSQIGVVVARSSNANFASALSSDSRVQGVGSTSGLGVKVHSDDAADQGPLPGSAPATDNDTLSGLQWDMRQIHTPEAHAITGGSPRVVVGDVDTGLDFTHPDLAPNFDASRSTDCSSGTPQPLLAGNDVAGHGTHTAGTIAAASNGTGIVGVAPNVKIAGIKSSTNEGFFFPEMVICSYMWVASHGIAVTNNSYFADPWLFNCVNDPGQRAIWEAERRAIKLAQQSGTVVVASEGNESTDLSHPTVDVISPDFPPGSEQERDITNACRVVPVEVPGVVGVTATGNLNLKSFYSSYGISTADVAAPGGDSILQVTPAAVNGRVLSTYPSASPCLRQVIDPATGAKYCYLQGTSMAGPHVAGVAALIISQTGKKGGAVAAALQQATDPLPCGDTSIYAPFPQNSGEPQSCQGGTAHNSFYGAGQINALKAVS